LSPIEYSTPHFANFSLGVTKLRLRLTYPSYALVNAMEYVKKLLRVLQITLFNAIHIWEADGCQ
jgi:hypothetical protein